jgi:hypothetical protein
VLGYVNFSAGTPDAAFQRHLNELFRLALERSETDGPAWLRLGQMMRLKLEELREASETFQHVEQAEHVLRLVFDQILPAYRRHHGDLLFHQTDEQLFQPLFIARVFEAVLAAGGPWEEGDRIQRAALERLNDFVGRRPVAVLHTQQRIEPYAHERVRPIPLYIRGVEPACGRYEEIIRAALDILCGTDAELLRRAWFDPDLMDELALDPRAYDFDHPVHRRLNYQFGGWDPDLIDGDGRYRRFVLRQVTVDALLNRADSPGELSREEALFEAAAVLAGTLLMASGTSGSGPDSHDSSVTMAKLVRHIAAYRDDFYNRLLDRLSGARAERLKAEADQHGQPLAGARQHLNRCLSRLRAKQLQHVHLAELFARMGYPEAARQQAGIVPVASARITCEIDCRLAAGHEAVKNGQLKAAAECVDAVENLLRRGIQCGALVDPWNILGFQGRFSLTPAMEDSVTDHRVEVLLRIVDQLFGLHLRLAAETAAAGEVELGQAVGGKLDGLAAWWDQHATGEVAAVQAVSGRQAVESAAHLAESLGVWHRAGEAAGDIAFWQQHVPRFNSPKSYALVVEALLEKQDFLASMALLIQWVAHGERIPLDEEDHSFHELAQRWLRELWKRCAGSEADSASASAEAAWVLTKKFLDYLEANAEDYWHVPRFEFRSANNGTDSAQPAAGEMPDDEENADNLFAAAYDEMTYQDSTDDGLDADMMEGGAATDYELDQEALRIDRRLKFTTTLARLWKTTCIELWTAGVDQSNAADHAAALSAWHAHAETNLRQLHQLLDDVNRYSIPAPRGTHESLAEYDRSRSVKESLVVEIIAACVITADAARWLLAAAPPQPASPSQEPWQRNAVDLFSALLRRDGNAAAACVPVLIESLRLQQTLYVPLARGGEPSKMVETQNVLRLLSQLLSGLPRAGLLNETFALLSAAQDMEKNHPGGPSVTSFERLFEIAFTGIVECLARAYGAFSAGSSARGRSDTESELVEYLQRTADPLLMHWLKHSRGVRLSVLERLRDDDAWQELVEFIERYGQDLFTQPLLQMDRIRSILHHGVDRWLESLAEESDPEVGHQLLDDLDGPLDPTAAVRNLCLVLEAISENYSTYCDYNTTTMHSDHGQMLYTLLDFLRLKAGYNRFAWNLKPLVDAHRVLVDSGQLEAAADWRREFAQRTAEVADRHQARFEELCALHGMRLSSIGDRLNERFVRPLAIDRVCALIRPAVEAAAGGERNQAFAALLEELDEFLQYPAGSAVDIPDWLLRLEDELDAVQNSDDVGLINDDKMPRIYEAIPSWKQVCRQIESWPPR